jgi:DNA-binding transcriptional ArsR family regulator
MVKYLDAALDATFAALSDATRRAVLAELALGDTSVSRLAARFDISLPGVAKHLRVLEAAGLLESTKTGRVRRCHLVAKPMKTAAEWIAHYHQFWESQFDALARYLDESQRQEKTACPRRNRVRKPRFRSSESFPRRERKSSRPGPSRKE